MGIKIERTTYENQNVVVRDGYSPEKNYVLGTDEDVIPMGTVMVIDRTASPAGIRVAVDADIPDTTSALQVLTPVLYIAKREIVLNTDGTGEWLGGLLAEGTVDYSLTNIEADFTTPADVLYCMNKTGLHVVTGN